MEGVKTEPSDDSEFAQFCMICLDTSKDCKLYPAKLFCLDSEFEHLTGISLGDVTHFAPQFCSQCAQRLSNCGRLRDKCLRAYHSLWQLVQKHKMVTIENVRTIHPHHPVSITKKSYKPNHCDLHVIETLEDDNIYYSRNMIDGKTKRSVDVEYDPKSFNSDDTSIIFKEDFDGHVEFLGDFDDEEFIGKNEGQDSDIESSSEYVVGSLDYDTFKKENKSSVDFNNDGKARKTNEMKQKLCNIRVTSGEAYSTKRAPDGEFEADGKPRRDTSIDSEYRGIKLSGRRHTEHMNTQTADKGRRKGNTKCEECGRVFRAPVLLREHMHKHTGVKMYKCHICGVGFSQRVSMRLHVARHSGKQSYPCEVCHRPFANPANLKRHMPTHEPVRQSYPCQKCGKSFTSKPGRDQHIAHVHNKVPWPKKINRRRVPKTQHSLDTSDTESARHKTWD